MPSSERPPILREMRANLAEDLKVNPFLFDRITIFVWRLGQAVHSRPGRRARLGRSVHTVLDMFWMGAVIGAEFPRAATVGPGIRLPHAGRGVVLHHSTVIGRAATVYHRVTIGVRNGDRAPVLGDRVYVGSGAAIVGRVRVGDGARIGANAVVVADVPAGYTAVGVPATSRPSRRVAP